jgi:uncharacterized protein
MLELRPNCECRDKDLPPTATGAVICTFCRDCAEQRLGGLCPNCGGNLVPRPIRPAAKLAIHPASTKRVFKPLGCAEGTALKGRLVAWMTEAACGRLEKAPRLMVGQFC